MSSQWWQAPEARADLERSLGEFNALRSSPPGGGTALFCDLCEALSGLLATASRRAVTQHEDLAVLELRERLDRWLRSTVFIDRLAIDNLEALGAAILAALLGDPQLELAIYGTLAPGAVNHPQIAGIPGSYRDAFVRGDLRHTGWGAEHGFPALSWRADGPRVPVKVFRSDELERHWQRLDAFEGEGYCRILVPVEDDSGVVGVANLYADRLAPYEPDPS